MIQVNAPAKMRKNFILIFLLLNVLLNVGCRTFKSPFHLADIVKIELLKVRHPLLGGVEKRKELEKRAYEKFYRLLTTAKEKGITKMFTCYTIQVQTSDGKYFNLRTNGQTFFDPQNDMLYEIRDKQNMIENYWSEKPTCDDVIAQ